ncbi:MAG TPA: serine hydrolase domain-containing protein [Candidatus Polarisedimenticolia bacterium]|nr:serine hydrolase domain-containing protein [Candidatus Polarisedimenticolia bacterium]
MVLRITAVFAIFLASFGSAAEARSPWQAQLPAFDSAMNAVLGQGYPGGSLAVVRNGRLVYARGYGSANKNTAATPFTLYRQASISKAVTGSLLASVVAKGTISLDTAVLPFLGVIPVDPRANLITVRTLRDHTSGLAGDYFFESRAAASYYGVASPPNVDVMIAWTVHYPLAADPGTVYRYNNTNYALLSRVIERATGRTWIDLVREMTVSAGIKTWRLGQSLGTPSDEARYYEADAWRYTQSVFDTAPGTVEWPYGGYNVESFNGAVSLVSSVVDMARYDLAVARGIVPAPEETPIPTRVGWSYVYIYNGSMPGHYSFLMRIWNGTNLTVLAGTFNHRDAGAVDQSINQRMLDAYAATKVWPSVDLFGSY